MHPTQTSLLTLLAELSNGDISTVMDVFTMDIIAVDVTVEDNHTDVTISEKIAEIDGRIGPNPAVTQPKDELLETGCKQEE